jgi:predicted Rossmann fold flavoprotein
VRLDLPIVIVGAGAAGLVASVFAAGKGRRVLLLERTRDGGRKILISGGGRCNILPSSLTPSVYVTGSSPHTLRNLLRSWPLDKQQQFFEREVGVRLALERETGKMFPSSNSAREVRDRLVALARQRGAELRFEAHVVDVAPIAGDGGWRVDIAGGEPVLASAVVLASGGLSVPATGSDGGGLRLAARLGHTVTDTYPALTPLTAEPHPHAALAGVSLPVTIEARFGKERARARGGFLFTHAGYSGPSVLDVSHLAVRSLAAGAEPALITVRWSDADEMACERMLMTTGATLGGVVRAVLPVRLADVLLAEAGLAPASRTSELRRDDRKVLVRLLASYPLPWTGHEGYRKAEVTGGGVELGELVPRTLGSRRHQGLFLCGEMLDAFGPIGGYNFVWAWVTGRSAGLGAAAAT